MSKGISYKVSAFYDDIRIDDYDYDIVTYCDICDCEDCPKYGDDCDGKSDQD